MKSAIIEVRGLDHAYGDVHAVDDISFTVEEGEIYSFLGPNGAGKSTVINVLTTLLRMQKGEVSIAGYNLRTEQNKVRKSIGIVFQAVTLDRDLTVWETLEFHGRLYNLPKEERQARIEELLELVALEQKRETLAKELSGGMRRRLEIARGLMTRPQVLFLDEPTIGLDPQTRLKTWDYLRAVNRDGTTIFLTTHYMDEADILSNRIGIIDHGRIITVGTPLELKNTLGEDVMYLETSDLEGTMALLRGHPSVTEIRERESGVAFTVCEDGTRLLPGIMDGIRTAGIEITGVNLQKPSMDDVFVHFTGRELRERGNVLGGDAS